MTPLPFYAVDLLFAAKAVLETNGYNTPALGELYAAVCAFEAGMPMHEGVIIETVERQP